MPEIQEIQPARTATSNGFLALIDSSLNRWRNLWIYSLLLSGFLVRVWHASGTFLNSDEAMHFAAANQNSWWMTYRLSLAISHPPLLIFLLHAWRVLGSSEIALRMPSILAGTACCWFTFRWASMLFEETVAWTAYVFVLFLPSSIELSSEIRQYALFLAFAMGSAYFLERALAKNSAAAMLLSGACLWLAIGSHFSAFLFAAALGIYGIWRMGKQRPPLRIIAAWEAGQILALGLCYFLYVTQISQLGRYYGGASATQGWLGNAYLSRSYYVPGRVNPLLFVIGRTIGVFQYTFQQRLIGDIAFLLFLLGIVLIFREKASLREISSSQITSHQLGLFLLLPFILNCAAALVRAYPYGGTRHSSLLVPFAIAGSSVGLAWLAKKQRTWAIGFGLLIALVCNLFGARQFPYIAADTQRIENMQAAIDFIHKEVHVDQPIFADAQTSLMLGYYLCNHRPITPDHSVPGFVSYECNGQRVIASTSKYIFTARSFYDQWQDMVKKYHLAPGSKIWVAQMGWDTYVAFELANFPEFHLKPHYFGSEIQIFDLNVGQLMPDPNLLPTS